MKPYVDILEELGFEIGEIQQGGGNHIKIEVTRGGKRRLMVAALTTSDRRSILNFKMDAKRVLREMEA